MKTVTVIGGGIAGISAAIELADAGFVTTLLEKRSILGGRASSTLNPESMEWIDNCQHVLLNCCSRLLSFYRRLGVEEFIDFHDKFIFIEPGGRISELKGTPLPSPFHIMPSFLQLKFLSLKDKILIAKALLKMAMTPESKLQRLDPINFMNWLQENHQSKQSIEQFWRVILVSALNEDLENLSSKYAFKTFKEAFFKDAKSYRMGLSKVTLSELYSPAVSLLKKKRGEVIFQKRVVSLEMKEGLIEGARLSDQSLIKSDFYISALPFVELLEILPSDMKKYQFFTRFENLETSPITGIHLFFDRKVTDLCNAVLLNSKIQWLFDKSKSNASTQYLQLVVSASREFIPLTKQQVIELALEELVKFFPKSREAKLLNAIVIKELRATFSPKPGMDEYRPSQKTPIQNLMLAGDWTKTDWPATMESAVRSGEMAAHELITLRAEQELAWISHQISTATANSASSASSDLVGPNQRTVKYASYGLGRLPRIQSGLVGLATKSDEKPGPASGRP